jgi:hypothetical protein
VARRQVFDPMAWCGAASISLCRGRGECYPSWKSSLRERGVKVTGKWFEPWCPSLSGKSRVPRRDLVAKK